MSRPQSSATPAHSEKMRCNRVRHTTATGNTLSKGRFGHDSFAFARREISSETDHDRACDGSLAAAELGRGANALTQRTRHGNHDQVGSGVHRYRDRSKHDEL